MIESSIFKVLPKIKAAKEPAILVSVARTRGSTPRNCGAMMWVSSNDTMDSIGGGQLEYQAIAYARELLQDSRLNTQQPITHQYPLGATKGQCCGGFVTLRFDAIPSTLHTATNCSYQHLLSQHMDNMDTPFPIMLFGAGHVGKALVRALIPLSFHITWIDSRPHIFDNILWDDPHNLTLCESDCPESEVDEAPAGTAFIVMTHRHDLDLTICEAILHKKNYRYFGLIGSKNKRRQFEQYWLAKEIAQPDELATMRCPIGIAGITGKTPAIIAASVAAELLQIRSQSQ